MRIEELTKSQIVLLTLLVSFMTSIATGIVTVSLMDQAPPAVEQTVSRVIERTIETVASSSPKTQSAAASVVTQQKTVVVKESDLVSQAIQKVSPSIVRILSNNESKDFLGLCVVLDAGGTLACDEASLGDSADAIVQSPGGTTTRGFVSERDDKSGIALLSAATTTADGKPINWTPIPVSAELPDLGGSVLARGGKTVTRVSTGIVTALIPTGTDLPQVIDTDVTDTGIVAGSPLIDTDGTLLGISTGVSRGVSTSGFMPANVLTKPDNSKKKS